MSTDKEENIGQIAVHVPLFLKKLWKMVNDKDNEDIISWNSTGDGFVIHDPVQFITKLLPHYFKHNNLASFVRQLNFYDFHKIATIDKDEMQFAHHYFLKDLPETLVFIMRKCPSLKPRLSKEVKEEDMKQLLNGVKELKGKHTLIDKELKLLRQENVALWNEINCVRIKYAKQTKIINKLIHFLISYIHTHQHPFNKQRVRVPPKSHAKNIHNKPSLLEIDYRDPKATASGAIEYSADVPMEEALTYREQALKDMMNDPDDPYTIQFPKSPPKKGSQNDASVEGNMQKSLQSKKIAIKNLNGNEPKRLAQLTRRDSLENIFQLKNNQNKPIIYSVRYQNPDSLARATASPQKQFPESQSTAPLKKFKPNKGEAKESIPITNASQETEPSASKSSGTSTSGSSLPEPVEPEINLENVLSGSEIQTVLPQLSPYEEINLGDNPKENLGVYVENTQLELDALQDILSNLNAKDWTSIFGNLSLLNNDDEELNNICDVVIEEEKNEPENDNVHLMKEELVNELEQLSDRPSTASSTNEQLDIGELDAEELVNEYLNTDFN